MKRVLICVAAATLWIAAQGEPATLEIKGVRLGMTKQQVAELLGSLSPIGLTIGGVGSYYFLRRELPLDPGVQLAFDDADKLERFTFLFKSVDFETLREAFQSKYSAMRCQSSKVQSGGGAVYDQSTCTVSDGTGTITLTRFAGAVDTGGLMMSSGAASSRDAERRLKKKGDI